MISLTVSVHTLFTPFSLDVGLVCMCVIKKKIELHRKSTAVVSAADVYTTFIVYFCPSITTSIPVQVLI